MNLETKFSSGHPALLLSMVILIWLSLFVMRWSAPPDLLDKDQQRPASYMADAALNGHWIVQVDDHGNVTSKPPLYTWIGAILILLAGGTHDLALYLPTGVSVLGCCLLMWHYGRKNLSAHAAFIGAVILLLSPIGLRILYLARTDALFSFTTFLTACLGFRAWQRGGGWIWFWLSAALTALTKGPLGLVLSLGGWAGLFFMDRRSFQFIKSWPGHVGGMMLYLTIFFGWLLLAYMQLGDAVFAKIIGREHLGHMDWGSDRYTLDFFFFTKPALYFIGRFFPWSIPAIVGVWRAWKRPSQEIRARQFEIFLTSYLVCGIAFFSVFPHQRPDHLFPLLPAAGLLAGRQLYRWFQKSRRVRYSIRTVLGCWLVLLAGFSVYYFKIDPATNHWFAKTAGVKQIAEKLKKTYDPANDIYFVDVPYGLQYYFNMMKIRVSPSIAAQKLADDKQVLVAVRDVDGLKAHLPQGVKLHTLMRWPDQDKAYVHIVTNRGAVP